MITNKMYKQIPSVHGSRVLTVIIEVIELQTPKETETFDFRPFSLVSLVKLSYSKPSTVRQHFMTSFDRNQFCLHLV